MPAVLHFRKELTHPLAAVEVQDATVRSIHLPDDLPDWLRLRERATAELSPAVRPWTADDFRREIAGKAWWRSDRAWLAVADRPEPEQVIGAVILAMRADVPVVHWLLVDPERRRRGVGRLLMSRLERAACDAGFSEVELETHAGWSAAVAFYQSIGYSPIPSPRPRRPFLIRTRRPSN